MTFTFNKYLLSAFYVPSMKLGVRNRGWLNEIIHEFSIFLGKRTGEKT